MKAPSQLLDLTHQTFNSFNFSRQQLNVECLKVLLNVQCVRRSGQRDD
jgi:hypothetical protein